MYFIFWTETVIFSNAIAQPAPKRCRSKRVWDFPTSILLRKISRCIYVCIAWGCYEASQGAFQIWKLFCDQDRPFSSFTWCGRLFFCLGSFRVCNRNALLCESDRYHFGNHNTPITAKGGRLWQQNNGNAKIRTPWWSISLMATQCAQNSMWILPQGHLHPDSEPKILQLPDLRSQDAESAEKP